jgi:hypothetical protein
VILKIQQISESCGGLLRTQIASRAPSPAASVPTWT